jgi:hypothetical protein
MPEYTLTNEELRKLKASLTRAKNSKDPKKVIATVNSTLARFEAVGFPDCWQDWERAKLDAELEISRTRRSGFFG